MFECETIIKGYTCFWNGHLEGSKSCLPSGDLYVCVCGVDVNLTRMI